MADKRYQIPGGYYKPGTPEYANFLKIIEGEIKAGATPFGVHGVYLPKTKDIPEHNYIPARRANPKNKHGE